MDSLTEHRQEKLKAVSHFSQRIVHELNNISTILLNTCDFLREDVAGNDAALKKIHMIEEANARMLALSGELKNLSFSRPKNDARIDVNMSIEEIAAAHRNRVHILCDPKNPTVSIAPDRLKFILASVVQNALEASALDSPIYVQSKENNEQVIIEVRDQGRGMTKEELHHLGEPFFSSKPHRKGAGLSLSKVFYWLSSSGGSIDVKSVLDLGTTVTMILPKK